MKKSLLLLIFIISSPLSARAALTDGLVGHWTLDGKYVNWATGVVSDISGQGNSGKAVSMSTTTSPVVGKMGQTLRFNGTNQWVSIGVNEISPILSGKSAITVSAWVRASTTPASGATGRVISYFMDAAVPTGGLIGYSGPNYWVGARSGTADVTFQQSTTTWTNPTQWHHLTGIVDFQNDQLQIYVDGQLTKTEAVSFTNSNYTPGTPASQLHDAIGAYGDTNSTLNLFGGDIDDVRLYNRALSAQEIRQLYALGGKKVGVSPSPSSGQQGLGAGLVGYWTMDGSKVNWTTGTVTDSSGQGNNGKVVSMSTTTSTTVGKIGQGFNFDGSDDYVNHGDVLDMGASSLSACGWFKADSPAISNGGIIGKTVAASAMGRWAVYFEGGKLKALLARGIFSADNSVASTTPANLTLPHHFCAVYDRSNLLTLYVDAVSASTISIASTTPTNYNTTYPLWIGAYQNANATGIYPGYAFDGLIDDVRVYNRALSAQEVRQLYALGGGAKVASSPTQSLSPGLVGYWTMDGSKVNWTTGTVTDSSGQGNNGKVVSMSTTTATTVGKTGQALNFDGTNDYVTVSNSISGVKSVSYWIKGATSTNGGIELNSNQWIDDLAIPSGFTSPSVYIDGVPQGSLVGSELTTNGTFDSSISSWTDASISCGASVSWVNGVSGDSSTGYHRFTVQTPPNVCADRYRASGSVTAVNKSYRVSLWYKTTSITVIPNFYSAGSFDTLSPASTKTLPLTSSSWRFYSFVLNVGAAAPVVGIYHYTPSQDTPGTIDIDAISIKEITTRYPITDTNWHHVTITTDTAITASAIKIGKGQDRYLNGALDEVRFYDRVLSAQEIRNLYSAGKATNR